MTRNRTFNEPSLPEVTVRTVDVDGKRHYVADEGSEPFPSVTTVIGGSDRFDSSGLDEWRRLVGEEASTRAKVLGASRGHVIHDVCESYIRNKPDWMDGRMPSAHVAFRCLQPVLDERIGHVYGIEHPVYSRRLRTGGRIDLVADFDGVPSIVDFKGSTSYKERRDIPQYFVQTRAYAECLMEQHGLEVESLVVLMAPDGAKLPLVYVERPDDWTELMERVFIHDRR